MIKISTNEKAITELRKFNANVIQNYSQMSPKTFSAEFGRMTKICASNQQQDIFCHEADSLATAMKEKKNFDFAGIIMSTLCKITEFIPTELEKYAKKGYEIAESNGDYLHMMARLNNLRKIYTDKPDRFKDYIDVLYKQEKCLKHLTNEYSEVESKHKTVLRPLAPKENYETMLAYVRTEIAKLIKSKHPNSASYKLSLAREQFLKNGNSKSVDYIDMLLNEIYKNQKFVTN